jgi:hypothetical protein
LTGVGLTGVGLGTGFAVGFALADLLGVGVVDALVGAVVAGAALDELALVALALEAAAGEMAALEAAALETPGAADDAGPLALATALDGVPSGAA